MRWMMRQIEAPASDTLSAAEVASLLGYKDRKTFLKLVDDGRFPEGIDDGTGRKEWLWEDVVWYLLHRRIRARLRKVSPGAQLPSDATPVPDQKPTRKS